MSDIIDDAQDHIEREQEIALQAARENSKPKYDAVGTCYYCSAALQPGQLYCDDMCAEDHAYVIARQKQNVKVL